MKAGDALQELERMLAVRGLSLDAMTVSDGVVTMMDFYRDTRADDCPLDADGDMLLVQWGTYGRGDGDCFELDITRQFIRDDGEDGAIWQLSLTFVFEPIAIARCNRWCAAPAELDELATFIRSHPAYSATVDRTPRAVELDFEPTG